MNQDDYLIRHEEKKMQQDILISESKKRKFINEIQSGLGDEIKEEPNKPNRKLSFWGRLKRMFAK